ncbi:mannose-1-phosphate guanylyltransferase/mannose-6-phosphate isomerase [Burkholderia pseudomultivorans]|uniref:mannose-1-phosphate guanylyltransferase/mannose-6-phosphate isomerase n=1 Tax=Burkholderia pseudomultivorans TaxID=1207504 RepID=UPI00075ECA33|nr:mannose-1-phosphate guanylyltransferase/mannose-6-phosphate isomerase [Burkholderia pseudomultivorans]KWF03481.1 mannose-1-phosphate guanylyltransferase [Burkholderia pseudomultivorans]
MLIPVILSGGAGTRLWPVSREGHPKPFMKLADGESLLLKTYRRAAAVVGQDAESQRGELLTVTNRDYYFMSKDEFACADLGDQHAGVFMLEPSGRNTAPAVAMAAHHVADKYGRDALMLVLAADHLVQDQHGFSAAVASAAVLARQGKLVTFGIVPTCPDTGFGYIEAGDRIGDGRVALRFVEKPDAVKAAEYLATGNYLWNSGMFCFKAGVILDEMARHAPDVAAAAEACWASLQADKAVTPMLEIPAESFQKMPDISIDYAVMERSSNVAVVPSSFGWSDIGSWGAVRDLVAPDQDSNRAVGDAIFVDSRNTYVQSQDRVVAAVGVADLMIIDTPDALLVAHPDRAQDVKQVVTRLKKQNHDAYKLHRTVSRPWGTYTVLEEGPRFKIKRIEVKPGASLSLQMHHHRSEHWIVVSGMAKVVNGEQEIFVRTNESTYIPAGHKHRLENPGVLDLVMIEVQSGEYLGEDDIVRFQDVYGRA